MTMKLLLASAFGSLIFLSQSSYADEPPCPREQILISVGLNHGFANWGRWYANHIPMHDYTPGTLWDFFISPIDEMSGDIFKSSEALAKGIELLPSIRFSHVKYESIYKICYYSTADKTIQGTARTALSQL